MAKIVKTANSSCTAHILVSLGNSYERVLLEVSFAFDDYDKLWVLLGELVEVALGLGEASVGTYHYHCYYHDWC